MKKVLLLSTVVLLCNQLSAQKLNPVEVEKKLGGNRVLELAFTQKLGEFLLKHGDPCNCAQNTKEVGATKVFTFKKFALVVLPMEITLQTTESRDLSITSRFFSISTDNGTQIENPELIRQALLCVKDCKLLKKEKEFKQKI